LQNTDIHRNIPFRRLVHDFFIRSCYAGGVILDSVRFQVRGDITARVNRFKGEGCDRLNDFLRHC